MACRTPSVKKAAEKSEKAKKAIENLRSQVEDLASKEEEKFKKKIEEFEKSLRVDDFVTVRYTSTTKIEFSHEFNLDQLVPVITDAISAVGATLAGTSALAVLQSEAAVQSYTSLVNSIAEAARSKSKSSADTTFSLSRIAPGAYVFLSTTSSTLYDKDTFGEESVTATTFYYGLYTSKKDAVQIVDFDMVILHSKTIIGLNDVRTGYLKKLAEGELTIAEYSALSKAIQAEIATVRSLIAALQKEESVDGSIPMMSLSNEIGIANEFDKNIYLNKDDRENILKSAIGYFQGRGSLYNDALRDAQELLNMPVLK